MAPVMDEAIAVASSLARWHPHYAASDNVPCYLEYMRTAVCANDDSPGLCRREFARLRACFEAAGVAVSSE